MPGYDGPAELELDGSTLAVGLHLSGQFDPLAGEYAWSGRVDPHPDLTALIDRGGRDVTIRTTAGHEAPASVGESNPWGGYRVTGRGRPPYPVPGETMDVDHDA